MRTRLIDAVRSLNTVDTIMTLGIPNAFESGKSFDAMSKVYSTVHSYVRARCSGRPTLLRNLDDFAINNQSRFG